MANSATTLHPNIETTISPEFPKSPSGFGRGVWLSMHVLAIDSINDMSINFFMGWVNKMLYRLPCSKCVKHATDYLSTHPMEPYREYINEDGVRNGMFIWSWTFHNDVNKRLGKTLVTFEDAYNMYLPTYNDPNSVEDDDGVCELRR